MEFRYFTQVEFEGYLSKAVEHLGNEISKARCISNKEGAKVAQTSFRTLFPKMKVPSEDQHIGYLIENENKVGMMHFGVLRNQDIPCIYLWDLEIYESERSKGHGKTAMELFESMAKDLGFNRVALNVFGHNSRARTLYEKLNYRIASISMIKDISGGRK